MIKLSDTQAILLTYAAQRQDGSLYPLPATITAPAGAVAKSIGALVKRGLAEERQTTDKPAIVRNADDLSYGLFVTAAGLAAINIDPPAPTLVEAPSPSPQSAARTSKAASVLALLQRGDGATMPELIEATGWLPHTTRAALTGLRKKGHTIERSKRDGATCYRVVAA